jgi:RNA 2',3'-cyclic 3'-phosphodiesterase
MSQTIRAFIAADIPGDVCRMLAGLQNDVRRYGFRIRWVPTGGLHLTLRFLGDISPLEKDRAAAAVAAAATGCPPFSLQAAGTGVFPGIRRPRVLWAGLDGDVERLQRLAANLETALHAAGFPREKKPYRGHLTLGRFKGAADRTRLETAIRDTAPFRSEPFPVTRVVLLESRLTADGAIYRRLAAADLERPATSI